MPKKIKSLAERAKIVEKVRTHFQQLLGVNIDEFDSEGLRAFCDILRDYGTQEHLTSGFSGRIYVQEFHRYIQYVLPLSAHAADQVALKSA